MVAVEVIATAEEGMAAAVSFTVVEKAIKVASTEAEAVETVIKVAFAVAGFAEAAFALVMVPKDSVKEDLAIAGAPKDSIFVGLATIVEVSKGFTKSEAIAKVVQDSQAVGRNHS